MNNINCEHCGTLIDINVDKRCPNCGAPYKNNKQYKEYQEYQKKQRELNLETQKITNDIRKDAHNATKKIVPGVFVFVLLVFIFITAIFFIIFNSINKQIENSTSNNNHLKDDNNNDFLDDILNNKKETITVNFNEYASSPTYDIKVDKVIKYIEKNYVKDKETYYGFHIVFINKTDSWKVLNNITLSYINNEGNKTNIPKSIVSTKELDFFATKISTYKGYNYYKIDDKIKDVTISFENIDITIPDFRNKI